MIPVCPKCDKKLLILGFKEVEADFCYGCRGLWLDAGELEALVEQTGATADDALLRLLGAAGSPPRGRKSLCPRCDAPLREIGVPCPGNRELVLDRCPRGHGLWFDADELARLLELFPRQCGAHKTVEYVNELFGSDENVNELFGCNETTQKTEGPCP